MHNLAIALKRAGHEVTGSDDVIQDPSRSRLQTEGLLPGKMGWDDGRISEELDLVIVGMHARSDNPELLRSQELDLHMESFPEFIANHSKEKKRVVIAGSHGKTTSTGMIMKALEVLGANFDYLVGSQLDGYDCMVRLSDAPIIVIEGDEYLTSPLDLTPKFWWYKPHLSMITGIAWDHINVFPKFDSYVEAFDKFAELHEAGGKLYFYKNDSHLKVLSQKYEHLQPYSPPAYDLLGNATRVEVQGNWIELGFFGKHNIENAAGVVSLLQELGYDELESWRAVAQFEGTARRLEFWVDSAEWKVIRDFAHSPSKVEATTSAVQERYKDQQLLAVYELHTFSSLQSDFMPHYLNALSAADEAVVYVDDHLFEHRRLPKLTNSEIASGFGSAQIIRSPEKLKELMEEKERKGVWLLMSSGSFSGKIKKEDLTGN